MRGLAEQTRPVPERTRGGLSEPEPTLRKAALFLAHLVREPAFLRSRILPLSEQAQWPEG
jgi:hypothetical protein